MVKQVARYDAPKSKASPKLYIFQNSSKSRWSNRMNHLKRSITKEDFSKNAVRVLWFVWYNTYGRVKRVYVQDQKNQSRARVLP